MEKKIVRYLAPVSKSRTSSESDCGWPLLIGAISRRLEEEEEEHVGFSVLWGTPTDVIGSVSWGPNQG